MKEVEAIDNVTINPNERERLIESIDSGNEKLTRCNNLSEQFASPTTPSVDCKSLVCG